MTTTNQPSGSERTLATRKRRFSAAEKQQYYADFQTSQLSMSEFCRQHQLSISSFSAWCQQFKRLEVKQPGDASVTLKPVSIASISPSPNQTNKQSLSVTCCSGVKLDFAPIQDPALIVQIIKELSSCN